jgi:hypothetical protein
MSGTISLPNLHIPAALAVALLGHSPFKDFEVFLTNGCLSSRYTPLYSSCYTPPMEVSCFRWIPGTGPRVKWTEKLKWKPLPSRPVFVPVRKSRRNVCVQTPATDLKSLYEQTPLPFISKSRLGNRRFSEIHRNGAGVHFRTCICLIRKNRRRRKTSEF